MDVISKLNKVAEHFEKKASAYKVIKIARHGWMEYQIFFLPSQNPPFFDELVAKAKAFQKEVKSAAARVDAIISANSFGDAAKVDLASGRVGWHTDIVKDHLALSSFMIIPIDADTGKGITPAPGLDAKQLAADAITAIDKFLHSKFGQITEQ